MPDILSAERIAEIEEFMKHVGDHPYCKHFIGELIISHRAQADRIAALEAEVEGLNAKLEALRYGD